MAKLTDEEIRKIPTPKTSLDERQKAVLRVYVSDGRYQIVRTVELCRKATPPIRVAKDSLRKWLRSDKGQDFIERLQKESGLALVGVRLRVIEELASVALSSITDVLDVDPETGQVIVKNISKLPSEIQRNIKRIRLVQDKRLKGDHNAIEIEMHDKMTALRELSKITNAQKVFEDADEAKVGGNQQLAGLKIIMSEEKAIDVLAVEVIEEEEKYDFI